MNVLSRVSLMVALAASAACDDDRPNQLATAPVAVAPDALSAYLSVSNPNAKVGDQVTVTVRALRGSAVGLIGSFTVRLAYDSTRLSFREAGRNAQGMVMTNAANRGVVVAAGASAEGFGNDELVAATFDVRASGALASLALTVSELNSLKFENQMSRMKVMKGIYRDAPAGK